MFKYILVVAFLGLAVSTPVDNADFAAETKLIDNVISPEGIFHYAFQTSNGIDVDSAGDASTISGKYKYVSPDGTPVELTYTADVNGFQPQGAHLPTSPPIPESIIRALKYIEAHPPPPEQPLHG